jgi:hypothetical protein
LQKIDAVSVLPIFPYQQKKTVIGNFIPKYLPDDNKTLALHLQKLIYFGQNYAALPKIYQ